jgi:hypothetical protein
LPRLFERPLPVDFNDGLAGLAVFGRRRPKPFD